MPKPGRKEYHWGEVVTGAVIVLSILYAIFKDGLPFGFS